MKENIQNLFQMLKVTYYVWCKPKALNLNNPIKFFGLGHDFAREMGHKEFDLIELENELNSRVKIQKKAIVCFEAQGFSLPIFLN